MFIFSSCLSQTPSCNVHTILCVVSSCQALVVMIKQMCGEGLFCVGCVTGLRITKPCDLAGYLLILCFRLMPQNCRNLHSFYCALCTHPLSNVIISPSGNILFPFYFPRQFRIGALWCCTSKGDCT
jgi:hypothetical protein